MKKFSQVSENIKEEKYYLIEAKVQIRVKATNSGEAGYLADSILSSISQQKTYSIESLSEISKEEFEN